MEAGESLPGRLEPFPRAQAKYSCFPGAVRQGRGFPGGASLAAASRGSDNELPGRGREYPDIFF